MKDKVIQEAHLGYIGGGSDKVYHIFLLEQSKSAFVVNVQYGRRGGTMAAGTKTNAPVSLDEAKRIFQRTYNEKFNKGYRPHASETAQPMAQVAKQKTGIMPQLLNMIGDDELRKVLRDSTHWMQEKMDGVRLLIEWMPERMRGVNRSGEEVALLPEVAEEINYLVKVAHTHFHPAVKVIFDGELVGNIYHVFDLLQCCRDDLGQKPFGARYVELKTLLHCAPNLARVKIVDCYFDPEQKQAFFTQLKARGAEGAVFKRSASLYVPGRPNSGGDQLKYKFWATGDFVVTQVNQKRSVAVHALDAQGNDVGLGNVTVPRNYVMPSAGDVVQVRYLYAYRDGCLYQPQFEGTRDDKKPAECLMTQLKYKGEGAEEES